MYAKTPTIVLTLLWGAMLLHASPSAAADQGLPPTATPRQPAPTRVLALARELPPQASLAELRPRLDAIFREINRSLRSERETVYQALQVMAGQPNLVPALASRYASLARSNYHERLLTIALIGEVRRTEALAYLQQVASAPLPPRTRGPRLTPRDYEEMIQAKAVQGIAYLRTDQALAATIGVMLNHPSQSVRIAAIDAYMWNLDDSRVAADNLYRALPQLMHRYVDQPRFYRGMSIDDFNARLRAWQQTWGN